MYDVFVDLREHSPTFGKWDGYKLSGYTRIWIPQGCAHGFLVLSETANFNYLVNNDYMPAYERTLLWNDPDLNIDWPVKEKLIISKKDQQGHPFKNLQ